MRRVYMLSLSLLFSVLIAGRAEASAIVNIVSESGDIWGTNYSASSVINFDPYTGVGDIEADVYSPGSGGATATMDFQVLVPAQIDVTCSAMAGTFADSFASFTGPGITLPNFPHSFVCVSQGLYDTKSASFLLFPGSTYELSTGSEIGSNDGAGASIRFNVSAYVPEPPSLVLLGVGLLGMFVVPVLR